MSHKEARIVITGVLNPDGGVDPRPVPRLEIYDFIKNEKQFALYVQALAKLSERDQSTNPLSFYQLGGIHGDPIKDWNGATGKPEEGYCQHGTPLFPPWHRPYVALWEECTQALQSCAREIAAKYTHDNAAWKRAAEELRSPYWDWARHYLPPPEIIEYATLNIVTPESNGIKKPFPNPNLAYVFHPNANELPSGWHQPKTVRHPRPTPEESLKALKETLLGGAQPPRGTTLRKSMYNTLTLLKTWDAFSSNGISSGVPTNSLESIHGTMHVRVGGGGHMGSVPVAAFDPIFWLHHTNVDRYLALWQAMNPGVWVPGNVDLHANLTPFWNSSAEPSFWKSSDTAVKQWTKFNFNYPEFVGLEGKPEAEVSLAIHRAVNELYGSDDTGTTKQRVLAHAPTAGQAQTAAPPAAQAPLHAPVHAPVHAPGGGASAKLWFVRIRSQKYALRESYTILVFLGQPPESPSQWRTSETYAGDHAEFVNSDADQCPNCVRHIDVLSEGFVDLTEHLLALGYLTPDRSTGDVTSYIHDNIHWRIQKANGTVVPAGDLPGLEVAVLFVPLAYSERQLAFEVPEGVRPTHLNVTGDHTGGRIGHRQSA